MSRPTTTLIQALILVLAAAGLASADWLLRPPPARAYAIVDTKEARALYESSSAVFIDARAIKRYREGHIPGAILLDVEADFETGYQKLLALGITPDQAVVTYCDGMQCARSRTLATRLIELGHTNVAAYEEGWPAWKSAGGDTAAGDP